MNGEITLADALGMTTLRTYTQTHADIEQNASERASESVLMDWLISNMSFVTTSEARLLTL